jgi:hypothetical protein
VIGNRSAKSFIGESFFHVNPNAIVNLSPTLKNMQLSMLFLLVPDCRVIYTSITEGQKDQSDSFASNNSYKVVSLVLVLSG